jgi:hypothetical protein
MIDEGANGVHDAFGWGMGVHEALDGGTRAAAAHGDKLAGRASLK